MAISCLSRYARGFVEAIKPRSVNECVHAAAGVATAALGALSFGPIGAVTFGAMGLSGYLMGKREVKPEPIPDAPLSNHVDEELPSESSFLQGFLGPLASMRDTAVDIYKEAAPHFNPALFFLPLLDSENHPFASIFKLGILINTSNDYLSGLLGILAYVKDIQPVGELTLGLSYFEKAIILFSCYRAVLAILSSFQNLRMAISNPRNELTLSKRVGKAISGIILGYLGGSALRLNVAFDQNVKRGAIKAARLSSDELRLVSKNKLIPSLGLKKECNAIIIDGFHNENDVLSKIPIPQIRAAAQSCNFAIFRPINSQDFCEKIDQAVKSLGAPLDAAVFAAHGDDSALYLNEYFFFSSYSKKAIECLDKHLKGKGQVVLYGCETAKGAHSLVDKVASLLPGREIVGNRGFANVFFSPLHYIGNKFRIGGFCLSEMRDTALDVFNWIPCMKSVTVQKA